MNQRQFRDAMRRIVTGELGDGRSTIVLDGPPSHELGQTRGSGLHEIWTETIAPGLASSDHHPRGSTLSPDEGVLRVRWFVVNPEPDDISPEKVRSTVRQYFREMGAEHEISDQHRHPSMHQTKTLDVVTLIAGNASLILDDCETRLSPGQVVIQRGTSHAWKAHGGPALFLAVLIGCVIDHQTKS